MSMRTISVSVEELNDIVPRVLELANETQFTHGHPLDVFCACLWYAFGMIVGQSGSIVDGNIKVSEIDAFMQGYERGVSQMDVSDADST